MAVKPESFRCFVWVLPAILVGALWPSLAHAQVPAPAATPPQPQTVTSPTPYAPPPCPACPPGHVCQNGGCAPAPYPVCAPGYFFDGYYCVPAPYLAGAPGADYRDPEEERAFALRMEHRLRGKFTLDLQGGLGLLGMSEWGNYSHVFSPTGALLFGYRVNKSPRFGMHVRGGILLGIPVFQYRSTQGASSESDSTLMAGLMAEAIPFFGPFGRFYVGPLVWLGYLGFEKSNLKAGNGVFYVGDGPAYGIGGTGGILVGAREQIDLNLTVRIDLNPDHKLTLFVLYGIGFHL